MGKKLVFLLCMGLGAVSLISGPALAMNLDIRIANGNDDFEEGVPDGGMDDGSTDLEVPYETEGTPKGSGEQVIGLRFTVPISKGAQILKAYLELKCDETKGGTQPVNVIIEGQLTPNAPAFTTSAKDITNRAPWTTAQVKWSIPNWTGAGQKSQSPDISAIIREIVDQNGWASGNALVLTLRDDKSNPSAGVRCAEAYEGESTGAPLLHIEVFNPAAQTPTPADGVLGVFMPFLTWTRGDGAIFHNVYLGKTPDLTDAELVASKVPFTSYYHAQGLEPGVQYYWRVDELDLAGNVTPGFVWSFVMQAMTAYYPTPVDGSVDASVTAALTWQPGLAAVKHHLYFGTSLDAVTQGTPDTDKGELLNATFTPPALDSVATYYWRVDELGIGGEVKTGAVWSFTTHLPVDDFESYTDDEGSRIYETWIDGWTNGTGSTVGNTTAPFAEQTIVRSGKQSMPMDYNNIVAPFYSEAGREFTPVQNWTVNEVTDLKLAFRGRGSNGAGALYVAVEDSTGKAAVAAYPNAAAITTSTWTQWKIPLSSLTGVNLSRVKKLYIGVGDRKTPVAGGAGRIYIDDIRISKP